MSAFATSLVARGVAAADPPIAQPPVSSGGASPTTVAGPGYDVVLLEDGGMIRGTIIEVIPGRSISIQTAAGTVRTVSADQARYFGPVSAMPGAAAAVTPTPAVTPAPLAGQKAVATTVGMVRLHLGSDTEGLTYYVKGALPGLPESEGFTRLCTAPCDVSIPSGSYNFAATSGNSVKPALADHALNLTGDARLTASHVSHSGSRAGGWALFGLGLAGSATLLVAGSTMDPEVCTTKVVGGSCHDNENRKVMFYLSALNGLVALLALPLALSRDETEIEAHAATHAKRVIDPTIQWPALATGNLLVQF